MAGLSLIAGPFKLCSYRLSVRSKGREEGALQTSPTTVHIMPGGDTSQPVPFRDCPLLPVQGSSRAVLAGDLGLLSSPVAACRIHGSLPCEMNAGLALLLLPLCDLRLVYSNRYEVAAGFCFTVLVATMILEWHGCHPGPQAETSVCKGVLQASSSMVVLEKEGGITWPLLSPLSALCCAGDVLPYSGVALAGG